MSTFYINNIYKGSVGEHKLYKGSTVIKKTYKGANNRFQYIADLHLNCSLANDTINYGYTTTLTISTPGSWKINYSGSGITFSSMSGTGNSTVTITAGNSDSTNNFTVSTDFKSESFTVKVVSYTRLDWLYYNNHFSWSGDWLSHVFNFTTVQPSQDMKMRYKFIWQQSSNDIDIGAGTDNSTGELRVNCRYSSMVYYLRFSNIQAMYPTKSSMCDITFSNFQIYDNINNTALITGTTQSPGLAFLQNLVVLHPLQKVIEFMIYDVNDNLLLDAIPVILNNVVGMYDKVGGGFYTIADQQMIPVYQIAS